MRTKTFTTILISCLCSLLFSNIYAQHVVLLEEYTGRGCGPCGISNPAFDAKCEKNFPNKVVVLKYEEYIGTWTPPDLLNSFDGKVRKAYYSSSSAPIVTVDGNYKSYHIDNLSQKDIDTRAAAPSPFSIELNYNYNATFDSMSVSMKITATQAFTAAGSLYARIAIAEKLINYYVPTVNVNGEMFFHHVFRKMLPSATGYSLPTTWTVGQVETINITDKIPSNIFNLGDLELVSFIQDDGTKEVKQAAYGAPKNFDNEAGLDTIKNIPAFQCNLNDLNPKLVLTNHGNSPLTQVSIKYIIDNGAVQTQNWTGNLATGASEEISLPIYTPTHGRHILKAFTSMPNNDLDRDAYDDTVIYKFSTLNTFTTKPFTEEFDGNGMPPAFAVDDIDLDGYVYTRTGYTSSFGIGKGSLYLSNFRQINPNQYKSDHLYLPPLDLSNMSAAYINFDHAYATYTGQKNVVTFKLQASSDCGNTWTDIYSQRSDSFATDPSSSIMYIPITWKSNSVSLNTFAGQSKVIVRIETSAIKFDNRLWLDKIGMSPTVGIESVSNDIYNSLEIYPNPMTTSSNLKLNLPSTQQVSIKIINMLGNEVYNFNGKLEGGIRELPINTSILTDGFYLVKMETISGVVTKKLLVNK